MSYSALLRAAVTACREEIARGSRRRSMAPGAWHEGAVTGVCRGASIAVHGRCSAGPGEIAERAGAARPAIGRGGAQGAVGRRRDRAAEKTHGRGLGRVRASAALGAILGAILADLAGGALASSGGITGGVDCPARFTIMCAPRITYPED